MKPGGARARQLTTELYEQQKAATRAANVAAGLRLFSVWNDTAQHLSEIEAFSHEDAARRYRVDCNISGYACIITKDAEAVLGLREGNLRLVQHTHEPNASL